MQPTTWDRWRQAAPCTAVEITQQPDVWRDVPARVAAAPLDAVLAPAFSDPEWRIVLMGAGTSAFVGEVIAPELSRHLGRQVEAIHTTDFVATPSLLSAAGRPAIVVSFARSGDSPESTAAVELANGVLPAVRHLAVTCNPDGALAAMVRQAPNSAVIQLPEQANDRGFAMTSSFTGMALAALLAFGVSIDVEALATSAETVLAQAPDEARRLVAEGVTRLAYLGSGPLHGLARESALKCLELTAGELLAVAESSLGFRHGPKAMLNPSTAAIVYLSSDPYSRAYDLDIVRELAQTLSPNRVVVIDPAESTDPADLSSVRRWAVPGMATMPDAVWAIVGIVYAQTLALAVSIAADKTPDNPFPSGEVNRVVQGVRIHPYQGGR